MALGILDDVGRRIERGRCPAGDHSLDLARGEIKDAVAIGRAGRIGAGDNQRRAIRTNPLQGHCGGIPGRGNRGKHPDATGPEIGGISRETIDPQTDGSCGLDETASRQKRDGKEPFQLHALSAETLPLKFSGRLTLTV